METAGLSTNEVTLCVDGEDVTVRYYTGGAGPPVVFLHGIGLDAATVSWRHTLPALAEERSVYAVDLPGHGGSDAPARTYTTEYYVDTLDRFLAALGLEGAALVGLSMGGAVALGSALDGGAPESLVLVDSYGLGSDAYWRHAASGAVRLPFAHGLLWGSVASRAGVRSNLAALTGDGVPEGLVEDVYRAVSPGSIRTLRSWQRHEFRADGFRTDYSGRLEELEVPTLLVHGRDDPLLPAEWSREAAERVEDASVDVLADCGHWPPRERRSRFNRLLTAFLGA